MEFFETFWTWLDGQLQAYIGANVARVAAALTPAIVMTGTIYVMVWGYLQLTGGIDQPVVAGLKRIVTLAVVLALSLQLWLHNSVLVATFYDAPAQLAGAVVGAGDPVRVIDTIWARGASVAENLAARWTFMSGWDFLIMAWIIRFMIGALCVYTMFLIALSKVALAVLLALAPLFIVMLLFEQTSHYFRAWIGQLSNYALVSILTVMVCALLLGLVERYATQTLGLGVGIRTVDGLNMLLVCALSILFLMQITQLAASLSGGGSLNTASVGQRGMSAGLAATVGLGALAWLGSVRAVGFARGLLSPAGHRPQVRSDWNTTTQHAAEPGARRVNRNSIEPRL